MLVFLRSGGSCFAQEDIFEVVLDEGIVDLHLSLAATLVSLNHDLISQPFKYRVHICQSNLNDAIQWSP